MSTPVVPSAAMGTTQHTGGGGVFGAVRSLAHEVAAAAKQGPIVGGAQQQQPGVGQVVGTTAVAAGGV